MLVTVLFCLEKEKDKSGVSVITWATPKPPSSHRPPLSTPFNQHSYYTNFVVGPRLDLLEKITQPFLLAATMAWWEAHGKNDE